MQFIVISEFNSKDQDTVIHYCQWTGNETALKALCDAIQSADISELTGHYSTFECSRVLLSESAVDEHMKLNWYLFKKHVGTFKWSPPETTDEYEIATSLNECFYRQRLGNFFKTN